MKNIFADNSKKSPRRLPKNYALIPILLIVIAVSFSGCSITDYFTFQNSNNTVNGIVELADRINEEAKSGTNEVTLFVKDASEDQIKNMTGDMGLFWGTPTQYTILKAISDENMLKIKFFIESSDNYYVLQSYLNGEPIPEENKAAAKILTETEKALDEAIKPGMSDYEKELSLHDWLVENLEYDETIKASSANNGSYGALVNKATMCRGYAESMKLLSECCGLTTRIIVGTATDAGGEEVNHAWNLVQLNNKWYQLDVTYDDPIGENTERIHHYYFNLNDTDMGKDHEWNKDYFPECDNDSYMYYKKNDLYYTNFYDFETGVKEAISYDKPDYIEVLLDAETVYESQIRFIFDEASVRSVLWSAHGENPVVVCISPEYD